MNTRSIMPMYLPASVIEGLSVRSGSREIRVFITQDAGAVRNTMHSTSTQKFMLLKYVTVTSVPNQRYQIVAIAVKCNVWSARNQVVFVSAFWKVSFTASTIRCDSVITRIGSQRLTFSVKRKSNAPWMRTCKYSSFALSFNNSFFTTQR